MIHNSRSCPAPGALLLLVATSVGLMTESFGQDPSPEYMGNVRCLLCHDNPLDVDLSVPRDLCLLNESRIFDEQDKHGLAYVQMFEERGLRMLTLLGIPFNAETKEFTDLDRKEAGQGHLSARSCLSCHANWLTSMSEPPATEVLLAGVTCESCHGPGSRYDLPHSNPREWRPMTPAQKEELGMVDVRNSLQRAEQCFSCHIGNKAEGKVVTHEMYAAGHPPLPGIEIESFASQMPRHWRSLREKSEFAGRQAYLKANYPERSADDFDNELPRTKSVMVGSVIAAREWLQLLADVSTSESHPEFAVFDCQACHHDLEQRSWRQVRGYKDRIPGRPAALEWPTALLQTAMTHLGHRSPGDYDQLLSGLQGRLAEVEAAITKQPFGDSTEIQRIIHEPDGLSDQLTDVAEAIESMVITDDDARQMLDVLYQLPNQMTPDYHSARQIAWATRELETERRLRFPGREQFPIRTLGELDVPQRNREEVDFFRRLGERNSDVAERVNQEFQPLTDLLYLTLPARRSNQIEEAQNEWLRRVSSYNPDTFRRVLQDTRARLRPRTAASPRK